MAQSSQQDLAPHEEGSSKDLYLHTDSKASPSNALEIITEVESYFESPEDSPNSLFDDTSPVSATDASFEFSSGGLPVSPAQTEAPQIPGLFFDPSVLVPPELANDVVRFCFEHYFNRPGVNQIMLFGVASGSPTSPSSSGLPPVLATLLSTVSSLSKPSLSAETYDLLFPRNPATARQAILNLYQPGEGIVPHVDLLKRFGDGIVGVSFGSSCVMDFAPVETAADAAPVHLFLPERSIIVLSGDSRYAWTHGIDKRTSDLVADGAESRVVPRGVRLSITFRWLLPGADVVGQDGIFPGT
ncbi:hypothetical protein R3P38DRAFT_2845616 [Favolaschia claudopus]|uniref:Fe2OG dioxygenase domain-containing protein n=1 Tax=Favolaschia claudopus TaxID=2862362 RepID=A0AAW0DTY8_9AGAR